MHQLMNSLVLFSSHKFLLHILQPNRIVSNSKTLTDNIFSNILSPDSALGNLNTIISDLLPQFTIVFTIYFKSPTGKSNIHERGLIKLEQQNFIVDSFSGNWSKVIKKNMKM